MKLCISGTYSSGKTKTVMALSHYTGIPRTLAKTIREIMPDAVPGKSLAEITPAEFIQLTMRRHTGRAVAEALLGDTFLSDGSSLQEWLYGRARVRYGMNPNTATPDQATDPATDPAEMAFFEQVVAQFGHACKQHVRGTFDAYVHLKHELPITNDGHRPMNESFRGTIDQLLQSTLAELRIPTHVVSGTFSQRLARIVEIFDLPTIRPLDEAIELARQDYTQLDLRLETQRANAIAVVSA